MISFAVRNLKVFFRDKSSVFFSLLSVFIIIGLYALFLGNVWSSGFKEIGNIRFLMDSWMMAGLLAVTTVTATMGAFGIMVEDETKKYNKDFYSSPLSRSALTMGYLLGSFVISVIMSIVALVLIEIYIVLAGGSLLSIAAFAEVILLVLLSAFSNTAMLFFITSFFKSQNAFATASTIIGTVIGFLTGIYIPIGSLPSAVQLVIKVFPPSHAAVLFRQIIMAAPLSTGFAGAPAQALAQFKTAMGVSFDFGGTTITPLISIVVLLLAAVVFCLLALWRVKRKRKG